ncbi:hypothetical protein MHU86_185 [Fragilaria crotonensis]|nr:hypothetical protein MHU86_185 [Fragilaria crotonensis]
MTRLSDSQREAFTALRVCINESQRMTLEFLLGLLARAIGSRSRNDLLACIGGCLHLDSQTASETAIVAAYITVVRDLASPAAIGEMQVLVRVATESSSDDSSSPTVDPPETPEDSSSFNSGRTDDSSGSTKSPAESPDHSSIFSIDTESQEEMMRMANGDDSSKWTISECDTLTGEQTETFDDSSS